MQAQAVRQKVDKQQLCSATNSLSALQAVMSSGVASILYSRGLLPEECFTTDKHMLDGSGSTDSQRAKNPGLRGLRKGYSSEADRIIEIQNGAYDALHKGYLSKMVFAIYLDGDDPTNIIESYTFDITYECPSGSTMVQPVLHISERLKNVAIGDDNREHQMKVGPTISDVKRSIRTLIRHLILTMDTLNGLPKSCFVNFKLYYTDVTPDDYEPPCFVAGDPEQEKYYMKTHNRTEKPEVFLLEPTRTGHHDIGVRIASIAKYIPSVESMGLEPNDTANEEIFLSHEKTVHTEDAASRTIAWDDAHLPAGHDPVPMVHMLNCDTSSIYVPETPQHQTRMDVDAEYGGRTTPLRRLSSLARSRMSVDGMPATQVIHTQIDYPPTQQVPETFAESFTQEANTVDSEALTHMLLEGGSTALEDIDVSTQHIISTAPHCCAIAPPADSEVECYCNVTNAQDASVQCDACGKWFHVWCLGFHCNDPRLAGDCKCFDCRIAGDPNKLLLTRPAVYSAARLEFSDLVLFRRSLQIVRLHAPATMTQFRQLFNAQGNNAKTMWTRLEKEGYIATNRAGSIKKRKNVKTFSQTEKLHGQEFEKYFSNYLDYGMFKLDGSMPSPHPVPTAVGDSSVEAHSQTQDETQNVVPNASQALRKRQAEDSTAQSKRVKFSHVKHRVELCNI